MKKSLLALMVASSMLVGCASTSDVDHKVLGNELSQVEYVAIPVVEIEKIRTPIHTIFQSSKVVYETYMEKAEANRDYHQFMSVTKGKSEEEIKAIYADLSPEGKKNVDAFADANEDITKEIVSLGTDLFMQQELFSALSHKSMLASSGMSIFDIPSALSAVGDTYNEIDYLMGTVGHVYKLSATMEALRTAT